MGGDVLYRWGNPVAYGAGNEGNRKFFGQHDAQWIPEGYPGGGNLMVFNNNVSKMEKMYSTVDEWIPPVDSFGMYDFVSGQTYRPDSTVWTYIADDPTELYSDNISGAHGLLEAGFGNPHTYVLTIYALDESMPDINTTPELPDMLDLIEERKIVSARLSGEFGH